MGDVKIRQADATDGAVLAELTTLASDGMLDALLQGLAPEYTTQQMMSKMFRTENSTFCWKNASVAEIKGEPAGMVLTYPAQKFNIVDDGKLSPEKLEIMKPFEQLSHENSYYISAVAVYPDFRGSGIGTKLIDYAGEQAKKSGYDTISLHVFENNEEARKLYEKHGFEAKAKAPVKDNKHFTHSGNLLLMVKKI
jgi:ribosomal protein S18 acetylase RimI-like enzyme